MIKSAPIPHQMERKTKKWQHMGTSWLSACPWLTKTISQELTSLRDKSEPTNPTIPSLSTLASPEPMSFLCSLLRSAPYTTHKFHEFHLCTCLHKDLSHPLTHHCKLHITHQHTLLHSFFCKEPFCGYHTWRSSTMSTTGLSSGGSPTTLASSAPLPILMHITSPEQNRGHFPGHLSLGDNNSLWVGEVTEDVARIALTTTNSWGFPLSPTSVQNVLTATPNPSPDQFWSIINGLANTIGIRDDVHWEKVKGLEAELAVLQQRMDKDNDGLAKCPPGYEENKGRLPNFTIPLDDGTEWFACFIKQLDNGRVVGLHSGAKGEEEAWIIELYASPDYTSDKPIEPLPSWLCCCHWRIQWCIRLGIVVT